MVTRSLEQSADLCDALRAAGAEPIHIPLIEIVPLLELGPLDEALSKLRPGDWIFLTSQNAVITVRARILMLRPELLEPNGARIAAVGPATTEKARSVGLRVDFVPRLHSGVGIANELGERLRGRRVLLPRSDKATSDLPKAILALGGEPLKVVAYQTELSEKEDTLQRIAAASVDAITLFSPTEVHALQRTLSAEGIAELQQRLPIVAIGEVTGQACRENGVRAPIIAADTTVAAVIEALRKHFSVAENSNLAGAKKT